ncbi:MAG: hypothetical protein MK212_08390 [Saprospiraceae bacterium]|nr:hypothetical protein [Saprospiraceae bacterium]
MQNTKLINLLKVLNSRELQRFEEYVHSPFFNKHQATRRLCKHLLSLAPRFEHKRKLGKEYLFQLLYPDLDYEYIRLHRTFAQLLALLKDFLVQLQQEKDKSHHQVLLLEQLRQRKAEKQLPIAIRRFKTLSNKKQDHQQTFYNNYLYYNELDLQFIEKGAHAYDENLQLKSNSLDLFFILEKLKIACDMASRNVVVKADYECALLNDILNHVAEHQASLSPIILIYESILQMRTAAATAAAAENHYKNMIRLLKEHRKHFTKMEVMDIYGYALNFSIQQINQGKSNYYQEAFQHYQYLVEEKIILINNHLQVFEYINIVTLGMRVEAYTWVEQFIHNYKQYVPVADREKAYNYNLASLFYQTKAYEKALQTLHNVEFTRPNFYIQVKLIQLKCYYELDEGDALQSLLSTFSNYLHRKNVSEYWKLANLNTIKITKKLYQLKEKRLFLSKKQYLRLYEQTQSLIETLQPLSNKVWLETALNTL